jgi:hypothetical protein
LYAPKENWNAPEHHQRSSSSDDEVQLTQRVNDQFVIPIGSEPSRVSVPTERISGALVDPSNITVLFGTLELH